MPQAVLNLRGRTMSLKGYPFVIYTLDEILVVEYNHGLVSVVSSSKTPCHTTDFVSRDHRGDCSDHAMDAFLKEGIQHWDGLLIGGASKIFWSASITVIQDPIASHRYITYRYIDEHLEQRQRQFAGNLVVQYLT